MEFDLNRIDVNRTSPKASQNVMIGSSSILGISPFQSHMTGNVVSTDRPIMIAPARAILMIVLITNFLSCLNANSHSSMFHLHNLMLAIADKPCTSRVRSICIIYRRFVVYDYIMENDAKRGPLVH